MFKSHGLTNMALFTLSLTIDILKRAVYIVISLTDAYLSMIDRASIDAELGADFRLFHTIHIAIEYGKL